MLHFLIRPVVGGLAEVGIVAEHAVEVDRIVGAIPLHHGGGFDQGNQIRIDLGGIEAVPGHILDAPMLHGEFRTVGRSRGYLAPIGGIRKSTAKVVLFWRARRV